MLNRILKALLPIPVLELLILALTVFDRDPKISFWTQVLYWHFLFAMTYGAIVFFGDIIRDALGRRR